MGLTIGDLPNTKMEGLSYHITEDTDLSKRVKSIMVCSAPGSGKGSVIAHLAAIAYNAGSKVLIWVHRTELCEDLGGRLTKQMGVPKSAIGYIMSGVKERRNCRIQIASVMTKIRRDTDWLSPDLILTDECHRILSNSQLELLSRHENTFMVGFTATPFRMDKKRQFSEVFDCLIQLTTYMKLVEQRFLLPTKVLAPAGTASLDGVRIRMGEYVQDDLEKAFMEERLYSALFNEWKKVTGGKMQTMVFNVSKKHNNAVNDFFKKMGVRCESVDDSTPRAERDRIVKKFKEGPFVDDPILVLNSIQVFTEGIDSPFCKVAILNYSSKSPTKYFQSAMRAGRPVWGKDGDWLRLENGRYYKEKVIIIDLGGNTLRHGMLDSYDAFGFDLSGQQKKGEAPTKVCPECRSVIYASYKQCPPPCGYVFPLEEKKDKKKLLDEVGLEELNKDKHWQRMILNMPADKVWSAHAGFLRVIALVRGYKPSWAYQALKDRGEYEHDGSPEAWAKFYQWIKEKEKEKGMSKVYERMKARQISK